jgi:hypothetical protein
MRLSILGETHPVQEGHRSRTGISHLKAGDILQARIIEIAASGKTVFQFDRFRAVADRPMGGHVGDVWHFEVAPETDARPDHQQPHRITTRLTQLANRPRMSESALQNVKHLRLTTLSGKQNGSAPIKTELPISPGTSSLGTTMTTTSASPNSPITQPVQILSTWFQKMCNVLAWPGRMRGKTNADLRKLQTLKQETEQSRIPDRFETTDSKKIDRSGEAWDHVLSGDFQLSQQKIKMLIYGRSPGRAGDETGHFLTAVFLLNLEDCGAVRVDIKMATEQIQVVFFVEDENVRRRFIKEIPELSSALSALDKRCYCRVDVSPALIKDASHMENSPLEPMGLDIRA